MEASSLADLVRKAEKLGADGAPVRRRATLLRRLARPRAWALALPTVSIVAAGAAFGLVVAGLAQSREAVLPLGSIAILTMAAAGGCWWPIDLEPRWMQSVARAFPTFWAMDAFNDLMIRRQTASAVTTATLVLLAYAAAYLVVGLMLFRRRAHDS